MNLSEFFQTARSRTADLAHGLSDADATAQSMPQASPAKWHLAHTSWFFEKVVLERFAESYRPFDERFSILFNSYYETFGQRLDRGRRGLLTRPSLREVMDYRSHIDEAMGRVLARSLPPEAEDLIRLGLHHEQQHQELLLTDILHLFAQNPLLPAYTREEPASGEANLPTAAEFVKFDGGIVEIGASGEDFFFDCEGPVHEALIRPFKLAGMLVTNAEWIEFIEDGGYREPLLWLSEGWAKIRSEGWRMPLYWRWSDRGYEEMTLAGLRAIDKPRPVRHISYYEADAFATWAGMRLPTEEEWEHAATRPSSGLHDLFGTAWQWTRSSFAPYPGFRPGPGAVGEYNGKFMINQMVVRGSSLATPTEHSRPTYRNFFPPDARWQFLGLRLASDE